jgi:hypothetical protein
MINYLAKKISECYSGGDEHSKKKIVIAYIYSFLIIISAFSALGVCLALYSVSGKGHAGYIDKYASAYASEVQLRLDDSSIVLSDKLTDVFNASYRDVFHQEEKVLGYDAVVFSEKKNAFLAALKLRQSLVLSSFDLNPIPLITLNTPYRFLSSIEPSFFNFDYIFLSVSFYVLFQFFLLSSSMRMKIYALKRSKVK